MNRIVRLDDDTFVAAHNVTAVRSTGYGVEVLAANGVVWRTDCEDEVSARAELVRVTNKLRACEAPAE